MYVCVILELCCPVQVKPVLRSDHTSPHPRNLENFKQRLKMRRQCFETEQWNEWQLLWLFQILLTSILTGSAPNSKKKSYLGNTYLRTGNSIYDSTTTTPNAVAVKVISFKKSSPSSLFFTYRNVMSKRAEDVLSVLSSGKAEKLDPILPTSLLNSKSHIH